MVPSWSPKHSSSSPSSTASIPAYLENYEAKYEPGLGADLPLSNPLTANNLYARALHTPFYQMEMTVVNGAQLGYGSQALSDTPLLGTPLTLAAGNALSHSLALSHSRLPVFDVKAYTFRKKPRHYVAVKHKNALRIEPIIYLKTSILDEHRQVVRTWDYLRFKLDRFRDNAQPKKKLSPEELRGARILDVDIVLTSPNNRDRIIEDSCPACVMRMDGERKIMQVLAKNFKQSPAGEPLIDIRKGHAIVCIKLNCYCDHHNEHEGFVVRMQTSPEVVRMGGSVKLRICCEARSKTGNAEQDAEEEDGLTDIDAPVSTGSRSPVMAANEQMLQSPSLSHASSHSPLVKSHQRTPSANSSSMASPKSMDERMISSHTTDQMSHDSSSNNNQGTNASPATANGRPIAPPKFRQIYPLTPSEGTVLGGTRVTIHGANFDVLQNPVVYFGMAMAELVTISHHDVMECTTPPAENLKPGIVPVRIASLAFPLGTQTDSVDFMYMAPPDYDLYSLAATSLSYAMANEYPQDNTLAYLLNSHGAGAGLNLGLLDDGTTLVGNDFDVGFQFSMSAKEDIVLDFLHTIQTLAPGRVLPSFRSESGHTLLHIAVQSGMARLVRELLDMGIDHTAMDRNNKTALHFARMLQDGEITDMLLRARIPPRPMVPRMDSSGGNSISRRDIVASLVQKYEEDLVNVVRQERHRKGRLLGEMRTRAARIMDMKEQATRGGTAATLIRDPESASSNNMDSEQRHDHPKAMEDADDDDIMVDDMSSPSSPEGGRSHDMDWDDESDSRDDSERKRRASGDQDGADVSRKLARDKSSTRLSLSSPNRLIVKPTSLTQSQMEYLQNKVNLWETSRSTDLLGHVVNLQKKVGLRTWICDNWSVSSLKDSAASATTFPVDNGALHVLALTGTSLHYFVEQPSSNPGVPSRNVEHWSLIEVDDIQLTPKEHSAIVQLETCGLVSRSGRDLFGQRLAVELSKENAQSLFDASKHVHNGLMRQLKLMARFEGPLGRTPALQVTEKNADWIESTLRLWAKLFNVEDRSAEPLEYSVKDGTFTLKPPQDNWRGYSVFVMGTIMRTLRDYDQCSKVRFEDVQVLEDGWRKPELVKELEKMSREMTQVDRWNFAGCGWSSETVRGFLNGLGQPAGNQADIRQVREPCRRISLARNDFGGENLVGHMLAQCLEKWRCFKTLDLTGCNIGLSGMEALIGKLHNMFTIRLEGNCADNRWWQWMDILLANNQSLHKCRLGAPIPPPMAQNSLIDAKQLSGLQDLTVLDLTTAPINQATVAVLSTFVSNHPELLTLALPRCELGWSSLVPLFKILCAVNKSTKFTFDVSQNPLFDSETSVKDWERSIAEDGRKLNTTPFGIKMQGLIIRDSTLRSVLGPLERATCFNELNFKGLMIKRENPATNLDGLSYKAASTRIKVVDASEATCRSLGQVLSTNKALMMLDISGTELEEQTYEKAEPGSGNTGGNVQSGRKVVVNSGRSTGGFGHHVSLAFEALKRNDTLRVLTMDFNRFGEKGMDRLADALKYNTGIGILSCDGNDAFTHRGLKAIEKILPAPHPSADSLASSLSIIPFEGTVKDAQKAGLNSTLSFWEFRAGEILMHKDLLDIEVQRLLNEFHILEKRLGGHEWEAKFGPSGDGETTPGAVLLASARKRHKDAVDNRVEYMETYSRILRALGENNQRSKKMEQASA